MKCLTFLATHFGYPSQILFGSVVFSDVVRKAISVAPYLKCPAYPISEGEVTASRVNAPPLRNVQKYRNRAYYRIIS